MFAFQRPENRTMKQLGSSIEFQQLWLWDFRAVTSSLSFGFLVQKAGKTSEITAPRDMVRVN